MKLEVYGRLETYKYEFSFPESTNQVRPLHPKKMSRVCVPVPQPTIRFIVPPLVPVTVRRGVPKVKQVLTQDAKNRPCFTIWWIETYDVYLLYTTPGLSVIECRKSLNVKLN